MNDQPQKPTGSAVRDVKGTNVPGTATEKQPVPAAPPGKKNVQVHAGNIESLKVQFLSEINMNLGRIAKILEIALREVIPEKVKEVIPEKPQTEETPSG